MEKTVFHNQRQSSFHLKIQRYDFTKHVYMFELFEPFECLNKDFKKRGKGGSTVKLRPPLQRGIVRCTMALFSVVQGPNSPTYIF